MGGDRPVFCGNFEYDASVREIERLFERYGPLDRVDMKTGEPHPLTRQTTSWLPVATQPFSAPLHALHPSTSRSSTKKETSCDQPVPHELAAP